MSNVAFRGGEVWWLMMLAGAAEPEDDEISEEVVVEAQLRISEAREAVHRELRSQGYRRVLKLGDRSWYWNLGKMWRPGVMVHEQGFVRVRGRPLLPLGVRPSPFGGPVEVVALVQSRRKVMQQQARLTTSLGPHLQALRDARWAMARKEREKQLVEDLVTIWFEGRTREGELLPDRRARRRALFARWLHTAADAPGAWARAVVVVFVDAEVQTSDHPFTARELARYNAVVGADREPMRLSEPWWVR